jgi:PAS domain S-box-containing protein
MARSAQPPHPVFESNPEIYRKLQDGAGEAILIVDPQTGQVLDGNARLCEATGYRKETLLRLTIDRLIQHPILEEKALLEWLSGHRVARENEALLRRRRGASVPVSVTSAQIDLDGRNVLHIIARDITRERRALADLRQAKETLSALNLAGTHLMVETDQQVIYRVITRELLRLGFQSAILTAQQSQTGPQPPFQITFTSFTEPLKRAAERLIGRPLADVRIDPAESRLARRLLALGRTVHTDRPEEAARELAGNTVSGPQIQRLVRLLMLEHAILAPLRYDQGISGMLLVLSDQIHRGDAEAIDAFALQASIALEKARLFEELRQHQQRLESEVSRRTVELTRAVSALKEADRRKDNFLANISHELRSPLVTVLGYTDLILGGKLGDVSPRQRDSLSVVAASARRLRSFIEELLEYSRYELTRDVYQFSWFDLGDTVQQIVKGLAPRFATRAIRVRTRAAPGLPRVWGDRERVTQVLSNLLLNAERFCPDNGWVRLAASHAGPGFIQISVTDNGSGISEEHLKRIFDRLYQVGDTVKQREKGAGLGLGLAIAKSIVEAHSGTITVRSRVGHGTSFRFTLPTQAPSAKQEAPPATGVFGTLL